MADITAILLAAQSGDASQRRPAEDRLRAAEEANFPAYLIALATEMQNAAKPAHSRYLAGLLIKNSLTGRADTVVATVKARWIAIDQTTKAQVCKKAQAKQQHHPTTRHHPSSSSSPVIGLRVSPEKIFFSLS
jgi:hypothetical protein